MSVMNRNTAHLLKSWGIAILLMALIGYGVVFQAVHGDAVAIITVAVMMTFACSIILWGRYKRLKLYREPTPDPAIQLFHRTLKRAKDGAALAAHSSAYAAILYGQYDRAREELCAVRWSTLLPMYQGYEVHIYALLALFQMKNAANALEFASEAKELCAANERLPGVKSSMRALEALIDCCRLLQGTGDPECESRLEQATRKLPGVAPAIPAWALTTHLRQIGNSTRASEYERIVDRLTPHCAPLHEFSFPRSI